MFSDPVIAILVGGGLGVWAYSKLHRSSGGNTRHAVIASVIIAILITIIITVVLDIILKKNK